MPFFERHVFVCTNRRDPSDRRGCCADKGGEAVRDALKAALKERGLHKRIRANAAGCLDQCARGVSVVVYPEQVWYGRVTVEDVPEIVESHLVGGRPVERLRLKDATDPPGPPYPQEAKDSKDPRDQTGPTDPEGEASNE